MTSLTKQKHRIFVELLYRKMVEKKVKREVNEQNQLYATIANRVLFITNGVNEHSEDIMVFTIFGQDGKRSDGFDDDGLSFDDQTPDGFGSWYQICNAINELGRRQASGADDALDAMIEELDDDLPF